MALRTSYFSYPTSQTMKNITLTVLLMVEAKDLDGKFQLLSVFKSQKSPNSVVSVGKERREN